MLKPGKKRRKSFQGHYHLMLLPGVILLVIFSVIPMFGLLMAFQDYKISKGIFGSPWVGMENFTYFFELSDSKVIIYNTLFLAISKVIANLIVPLVFAVLLNEVRQRAFKRTVQTIVYLPHFLSWVILAGIFSDLLLTDGMVNRILGSFGVEPIQFMGDNRYFPYILIGSDVWKEFGFNTIIYLAALAGIDPSLYEAASIDGANWRKRTRLITLPLLRATIILLATLAIGNILNAGFDQIFNMYSPVVYESSDVIDTYVYRAGILDGQYGFATAIGLMKSVIAFILIILSYRLAYKYANYRIF
ncbi:sugar ABC transporter permease [Paenibacillus sp. J23TS9]|uniref:ABC transporter permease n=1 Tax=Paenibacillus sp. J23TS9 TaxID=2807193 RepID=UPI001BCE67F4|nr:ABC transporter permease subunit [Paenibacillus sp. J23TS9]